MSIKEQLILVICLSLPNLCFSQNWDSIGTLKKYQVRALTTNGNQLYIGMDNISDPGPCKIKVWDGSQWDSLCCGTPIKMIFHDNELYGCGGSTIGVAKYDGIFWQTVGQVPVNGAVFDIHFYNNELYAAGGFDSIGGVQAFNIAKWDGTNWHAIDTTDWFHDAGGIIYSSIHYNGELYIAGPFQNMAHTLGLVCKWNGSTWEIPGGNINNLPLGSTIEYLEVFNNELYLGGYIFPNGNNLHDLGIVRWDGTTWKDVGGGINGPGVPRINRMMANNNKLFVAGYFSSAGNIPANAIAIWDGIKWCGLGSVINNQIFDFAFYDSTLVIGGNFITIDGDSLSYLARWIGGIYEDSCSAPDGISENELLKEFYFFPNPSANTVTINYPLSTNSFQLTITDVLGKALRVENLPTNITRKVYNISALASGIYSLTLQSESGRLTKRLVKE